MKKLFLARDKDGRLFEYNAFTGMVATDQPHRHTSCYPFDGNFYVADRHYMPKKGKEIDNSLYPEVTYENSPILFVETSPEEPLMRQVYGIFKVFCSMSDFMPIGSISDYRLLRHNIMGFTVAYKESI